MSTNLKLLSLLFVLVILIAITLLVKKNRITIKYSIVWYLTSLLLILFIVFPNLLGWFTNLFGIAIASNFIFALLIGFLFIITISLTTIVSVQKEQIRTLTQEVSILNKKNNQREKL